MEVSVVVIVKNAEDTIGRCIESLMHQTHRAQVIIVDGNSTDRTAEIVSKYPVDILQAPKVDNYGISRNVGVRAASGDFILFMDADDYCSPTWCENIRNEFVKSESVGIVTVPRKARNVSGWFLEMLNTQWAKSKSDSKGGVISWKEVNTKGSGFRKEAIEKAGWFDERMFFGTEDKEIAIRIARLGYKIERIEGEMITVDPVNGARNYLKDKFVRAGVGHGYMRKKHGAYRPPISGMISIIFMITALVLLTVNPIFSLLPMVLALFSPISIWRHALETRKSKGILRILGFSLVRWFSRVLETIGFFIGYLIPVRILVWTKSRGK